MADEEREQPVADDDEEGSPLATILTGVGCLAFSGYLFYYFTQFEAGAAGARRMWWVLASLYTVVGKWPPVVLLALLGVAALALGIRELKSRKDD